MADEREKKALYIGIIGLIVGSVLSGIALVQTYQVALLNASLTEKQTALIEQANNLTQLSLQLQNISSNFNPVVIPYVVEANLGIFNYSGNSTNLLIADGNLSLSLIIITPHAAILNFGDPQSAATFTRLNKTYPTGSGGFLPILDQNELSYNLILIGPLATTPQFTFPSAYPPYFQQYEAFVQSGVTQVNFTFPLHGDFYLNQEFFKESGQSVPFGMLASLANFNIKMTFLDAQTQQSFVKEFSGTLDVWINAYPPF